MALTTAASREREGAGPVALYSNTVLVSATDASGEMIQNKGVETLSQ